LPWPGRRIRLGPPGSGARSLDQFTVTLDKQFFPYYVQSASQLTIDSLTRYAGSGGVATSVTPPADPSVMTRDLTQQVIAVLHYHFTV
jgi:hypothetical protein